MKIWSLLACMDRMRFMASGSTPLYPSRSPIAIGKNVVMTTRVIFGAIPNPSQRTSRGAIAMVGIVCVTTSSGMKAFSRSANRSINAEMPKARSTPARRP